MSQDPVSTNRNSRLPWALLALVVAVIAGVTLYRQFRSGAHGEGTSSVAASDDAGHAQSVRRLSPEEVRALAARSPGLAGPRTAGDIAAMMERRERMAQATQARIEKRNADMAGSYAAEKVDPAWSGAHEKDLASLLDSGPLRDAGTKAGNFQAQCRSSMCRIQADFPDPSSASDWLQLYMAGVGDNLPVATAHQIRNPDGSVRIEIYGVGRKR